MEVKAIKDYPIGSKVSLCKSLFRGSFISSSLKNFHFITGKIVQRVIVEDISCMRHTKEPSYVREVVVATPEGSPRSFITVHPDTFAADECPLEKVHEFYQSCVKENEKYIDYDAPGS